MPFRVLNNNEDENIIKSAVKEKMSTQLPFSLKDYQQAAREYYYRICNKNYRALVIDYDNTIHNKHEKVLIESSIRQFLNEMLGKGIIIGIATGNGEFIQEELREYFDYQYHAAILVGYYNCGIISSLDKEIRQSSGMNKIPLEFRLVKKYFYENGFDEYIISEGFESDNPYELNFFSESGNIGVGYLKRLKEFIVTRTSLKIMNSPHSFDVIPAWTSKPDLCKYISANGIPDDEILTMGDCGNKGESDYELLCRENSLSVNTVSNELYSCWKFTPEKCINLDATWYYLKTIEFM